MTQWPVQGQDRPPSLTEGERIGDAERERAVAALSEHYAVGRLDEAELDARVGSAYRARTIQQLRSLFADLPAPAPFRPSRRERRRLARVDPAGVRPRWAPAVPVLPLLLVVVAVMVATSGHGFFVFPLLWFWFGFARRGWHHPR